MLRSALAARLRERFATGWGLATPIAWPNTRFDAPESAWVRYTDLPTLSTNAAIGDAGDCLVRHIGQIIIQVFTPIHQGPGAGILLAEAAAAIYENTTINNIHIFACYISAIGDDGHGWYQYNAVIPYLAQGA